MKLEKFSGDIRDRAGPSGQEDGPFDAEVAELWEVAEGDVLFLFLRLQRRSAISASKALPRFSSLLSLTGPLGSPRVPHEFLHTRHTSKRLACKVQ